MRFRSGRGILGAVILMLLTAFWAILTFSVWFGTGHFIPFDLVDLALLLVLLALSALTVWAFWLKPPLEIRGDHLLYRRSLLSVIQIDRSDVAEVRVVKTGDALRAVAFGILRPRTPNREIPTWVPILRMKDGTEMSLDSVSAGVRSGLDVDDYYGDRMKRMLSALQAWLAAGKEP